MSEQRETTQVITSENQAEFFAQKLGLAPEETTEAADEAEPIESEVENEPEAEDEAPATENERKPTKLQARFSELTKQREQARANAQRERDAREALEVRLQALERGQAPKGLRLKIKSRHRTNSLMLLNMQKRWLNIALKRL